MRPFPGQTVSFYEFLAYPARFEKTALREHFVWLQTESLPHRKPFSARHHASERSVGSSADWNESAIL